MRQHTFPVRLGEEFSATNMTDTEDFWQSTDESDIAASDGSTPSNSESLTIFESTDDGVSNISDGSNCREPRRHPSLRLDRVSKHQLSLFKGKVSLVCHNLCDIDCQTPPPPPPPALLLYAYTQSCVHIR